MEILIDGDSKIIVYQLQQWAAVVFPVIPNHDCMVTGQCDISAKWAVPTLLWSHSLIRGAASIVIDLPLTTEPSFEQMERDSWVELRMLRTVKFHYKIVALFG